MSTPFGLTAVRLLAMAEAAGSKGHIHVAPGERTAEAIARALAGFAPELTVAVLPGWDCLPYDRASPSREVMGRRLAAMRRLAEAKGPRLLLTTPDASAQRLPPLSVAQTTRKLTVGEALDVAALEQWALRTGHVLDERIDEPGEIAIRGQVIEIFPADATAPVRLDIADGAIATLRTYDPITQRTTADLDAATIGPASEVITPEDADPATRTAGMEHALSQHHDALITVLDLLPKATVTIDDAAAERRGDVLTQVDEAHEDRRTAQGKGAAPPPPSKLYVDEETWTAAIGKRRKTLPAAADGDAAPRFAGRTRARSAFTAWAKAEVEAGRRLVLCAATARDRKAMVREAERALGSAPETAADWAAVLSAAPGTALTLIADLEAGFIEAEAGAAVLAAADVLGGRAQTGGQTATHVPWLEGAGELRTGDLVTHLDHGIGVLNGLEAVAAGDGAARDTVAVGYARNGKLLLPVEDIGRLWRYGAEEGAIRLDTLNGESWPKRRAQLYAEIAESARGLVELAKARDAAEATAYTPPSAVYARFAGRFPFSETPDQAKAIADTLADLAKTRPMDRLIIADVGYGKTEVALRAAAAVALAGGQVAVVAPTTVLARQHTSSFQRRFEGLGVEVGHLSRLTPPAEAKAVKAKLASGEMKVVVGTHALASEDVAFADLGLMVIDEEQRFGAAQKAALRSAAEGVHVLTLTATPIPRTLQAAMVGLQDLSIIQTPPARRRPIRTFNTPFDPTGIRGALMREKRRGGQSFVVTPRIEDMADTEKQLAELVPELTILTAHGKMPPEQVDDVMVRFAAGEGDVLLATSIIESGLDVPRANTMIVLRAELFGLAQLHQLRGRVGRGRQQGACYLQTHHDAPLSEAAAKRLNALVAFDRLGAGLAISAKDLDVRGAGDLLGEDQAGHMKLIGLELYQHLLGLALRQARGETVDDWTPELAVGAVGELPAAYIPETDLRLSLYARLARITDAHEADGLAEEIEDRFGPPPPPARELLAMARMRAGAQALGVARVDAGPKAVALTFRAADAETTHAEAAAKTAALAWSKGRLVLSAPSETVDARLELTQALLDELAA